LLFIYFHLYVSICKILCHCFSLLAAELLMYLALFPLLNPESIAI
jgi:hypothetical protein